MSVSRSSVGSAMTILPTTVKEDASLFEIARHLVDERVGAVPVVDERDHLIGIVSYVDLLRFALVPGTGTNG